MRTLMRSLPFAVFLLALAQFVGAQAQQTFTPKSIVQFAQGGDRDFKASANCQPGHSPRSTGSSTPTSARGSTDAAPVGPDSGDRIRRTARRSSSNRADPKSRAARGRLQTWPTDQEAANRSRCSGRSCVPAHPCRRCTADATRHGLGFASCLRFGERVMRRRRLSSRYFSAATRGPPARASPTSRATSPSD